MSGASILDYLCNERYDSISLSVTLVRWLGPNKATFLALLKAWSSPGCPWLDLSPAYIANYMGLDESGLRAITSELEQIGMIETDSIKGVRLAPNCNDVIKANVEDVSGYLYKRFCDAHGADYAADGGRQLLESMGFSPEEILFRLGPKTKPKAKPAPKEGFVYFIQAEGTDRYKIGLTTKPLKHRMSSLAKSSPFPIKFLASAAVEDVFKAESDLHKRYDEYRQHGEWFELPAPVASEIASELTREVSA